MKQQFKTILSLGLFATISLTSCFKKHEAQQIKAEITKQTEKLKPNTPGDNTDTTGTNPADGSGCGSKVIDLFAGQHHLAGNITVSNDADNIYVTYNTIDGWQLKQTQLYVGSREGLPGGKKGNPQIGQFPYKAPHVPYVTSYTYTIPVSAIGSDSCFIIAAHAEVVKTGDSGEQTRAETAWSAGKEITPGGSWATYSEYCLCESTTGGETGGGGNSGGGSGSGGGWQGGN